MQAIHSSPPQKTRIHKNKETSSLSSHLRDGGAFVDCLYEERKEEDDDDETGEAGYLSTLASKQRFWLTACCTEGKKRWQELPATDVVPAMYKER